jgi:hypothetical protein
MSVRDLLELCNDASNIRIRIFDYNTEDIIFDSDSLDDYDDAVSEIIFSDMSDYEVGSYDLYLHNGVINLEINIDYEPEGYSA